MTEDTLWNMFVKTGKIYDYIRYSKQRDILYDDNRGTCFKGTSCR